MGKHDDLIVFAVGGIAVYFMLKACLIQDMVNKMMAGSPGGNPMAPLFDQINQVIGATCAAGTTTSPPAGGGGGGATVTGDAPYAMVGSPTTLTTDGQGTRHYACLTPETLIPLADGGTVLIKDLVERKSFPVYSVDNQGRMQIGKGHSCMLTRKNTKVIEVELDNSKKIKCTPDHRFMLRDGTYVEALKLKEGQSLMPIFPEVMINHKVVSVRDDNITSDVYDFTVDEYHNFALEAGVVVHNSGAPDDVTQEWEGETSSQNYMIVYDITLTEIDHDDTITVKFGGTHNGSGWYGAQYTFEAGQAHFGAEESHPDFSECVDGAAIGTFVNTRRKVAVVNIGKGERLEEWSHNGTAWQKDVESLNGVCGFRPNESTDEVNIRIDGAPGIEMHSAILVDIDPASSGQGGGTTTPPPAGGDGTTTPPPTTPPANGEEEEDEEDEDSNYARSFYVPTREPNIFYHWSRYNSLRL